jgi:hypothetical protein
MRMEREDEDGAEAARFGAATSGQVLVYGRDGALVFSGGITAARGHFGDNEGSKAIAHFVADPRPAAEVRERSPADASAGNLARTPVFGCPIFEAGAQCSRTKEGCPS